MSVMRFNLAGVSSHLAAAPHAAAFCLTRPWRIHSGAEIFPCSRSDSSWKNSSFMASSSIVPRSLACAGAAIGATGEWFNV